MFQKCTNFFVRVVQRYLPDPFLFAVILTLLVFFLGWGTTSSSAVDMVQYWGSGFWNLLTFSMQMVLILVTGHVLASSPVIKKALKSLASTAKTPGQAIIITTLVSSIAAWINWGFGLVVGALVAREMAKAVADVDFRVLVAGAYTGFLLWHAGISGSIPLTIATKGHFLEDQIGIIPTSETIFTLFNLAPVILLLVTLPFFLKAMLPKDGQIVRMPRGMDEDVTVATVEMAEDATPADRLENSKVVSLLIGILGLVFVVLYFAKNGFKLDLNIINFTFLFLGILLHLTPKRFIQSFVEAVKGTSGIILQFPFYAGIMGMMVSSGLAVTISQWFVDISTAVTFPLFTFLSAGLINIFVPSGGGQWAVQGPIMIPAAEALGVPVSKAAMAVAWGDAWTNMIQPFWALPLLAIAGLNARDIMGYCLMVLFYSGVIIGASFLIF